MSTNASIICILIGQINKSCLNHIDMTIQHYIRERLFSKNMKVEKNCSCLVVINSF